MCGFHMMFQISFFVFLTTKLAISSSSRGREVEEWNECQWTPISVPSSVFQLHVAGNDCLLEPSLVVQEKTSIPHNQGWSHCRDCGFMNGTLKPNSDSGQEFVDLTWSQWSDFFVLQNDRYRTNFTQQSKVGVGSVMISNPIFIIPLIAFHPGHVLVDLMEQVYSSMLEIYGEVRLDSILVLDVSLFSYQQILRQAIDQYVNSMNESLYGYMIRWLTNRPVIPTLDFLSQLNAISAEMVIFSDIHFGGDISSTFMHLGTPHHPCQFRMNDSSLQPFSQNYDQFHNFVANRVSEMIKDPIDSQPIIDVLFIYRNSSRSIVNMKEMINLVSAMNLNWLAVDFDVTPFKTQLIYLRKTRLLVAAAGTAMHNMIFMNHSTSAIVIMMEDWCRCSWQYVNQGILLGIDVMTYCQPKETENQALIVHWTSKFWSQCSTVSKSSEMFVDIKRFADDLHDIFDSGHQDFEILPSNLNLGSWCQIGEPFADYRQGLTTPQFMVLSITATVESNGFWNVIIPGELSYSQTPQNMLSSFPYLSACNTAYLGSDVNSAVSFCFPVDYHNYHSYYEIQTPSPSVTIHTYGKITSHGGKIRDSDNYISIDLRVRPRLSRMLPQIEFGLGNELGCPKSNSNQLICSVKGIEFQLCVGKIIPGSSFEISLQPIVKKLCPSLNDSSLCPLLSSSLSHCAHKRVLETQLSLPHPQYLPSPANPFIFLHIEMTAGSSIQRLVHYSSLQNSLTPLVPGYGVHFGTFDLNGFDGEYLKNVSVLAGHFSWGVWSQLPSALKASVPPCLVMGRHPVDRVLSYYYQRCFNESDCPFAQIPFNNLSASDLNMFLITFRQGLLNQGHEYVMVDEGVHDAACRALANRKWTTDQSIYEATLPEDLTEWEEEFALTNIESCVVGLQDDWTNTKRILNHWFPWVLTKFDKESLLKGTQRKESMLTLRSDLRIIIERQNRCDLKLFEKMKILFEKQLSVIETDAYL